MLKVKEPVSAFTHMSFAILAIPLTVILVYYAVCNATIWHVISFLVFGTAIFLLYLASTIYHMFLVSEKTTKILKKIDHMMIFILIAGSYTPICLVTLRGIWGWALFAIVWSMAIFGMLLKACKIDTPRKIGTTIYVIMGWCVVIAFYPLVKSIPLEGILFLALGGISYTVGAIIYALKIPKLKSKVFGFHELFHIFVMLGTVFHVYFMIKYILLV